MGIAIGIPTQNLDLFRQAVERQFDFDVPEVLAYKAWSYLLGAYSHIDIALYSL